ncbi:hypothetical protein C8R44DRAFT_988280 [Mycena epipterygia]|nr:hypothetical protein C8R44DRAFT_988280 [Mycena epipterygia]
MDEFDPSCEHCIAEQANNYLNSEIPPAPGHRHATSDPKETMRKELTQCQYCYKSRGPGVSLQKCGGCQSALYCSKECQKNGWKTHKAKCALNQRAKELPVERVDTIKTLRGFTAKHRPTIAEAGIRALNVLVDPARAERDILMIYLRPRRDSKRVETAFFATAANIVPIETFPMAQQQELRGQLKQASEDNIRSGMAGAIFVFLLETETGMSNVAPVGFPKASPGIMPPLGISWEQWLIKRLNEGIVV